MARIEHCILYGLLVDWIFERKEPMQACNPHQHADPEIFKWGGGGGAEGVSLSCHGVM